MNEALRLPMPGDTGDVLASIRRLIASDSATTSSPAARAETARRMGTSAGRTAAPPCAVSVGCARVLGPPPSDIGAARRTALSVEPTPAERPRAAAPAGLDQVPLRLNPDAMVAAADAARCPAGCPQLSQEAAAPRQDAAAPRQETAATEEAPSDPAEAATAVPPLRDDAGISAAPDTAEGQPAGAQPETCDSHLHDLTSPSNKETTMQAYPTGVVSPLHAEPVMPGVAERCAHSVAHAGPSVAAPVHAGPVHAAPVHAAADENPLRALLREVVREEFETEMQRRLDETLRGMIRGEIVVALTEALVRRPA